MNRFYHNKKIKLGRILSQSMKFPQYDIEELRHKDFTRFIESTIRVVGERKQTLCPFHEERTPSFFIYPNNTYYCFGCGEHGNAVDFLVNKFGYPFTEACEILQNL